MTVSCDGEAARKVPWSTADYAEVEVDYNVLLAQCGVPPRPAGRLWLLKPPRGFNSIEETLHHFVVSAEVLGLDIVASANFAAHVEREVHRLFQAPG